MDGLARELDGDGSVTVVALTGEIDLGNALDVKAIGELAVNAGGVSVLEFDLSAVTFIDSTGIGALVAVHNAGQQRGVGVRIGHASEPVLRVLALTGLNEYFGVGWDN